MTSRARELAICLPFYKVENFNSSVRRLSRGNWRIYHQTLSTRGARSANGRVAEQETPVRTDIIIQFTRHGVEQYPAERDLMFNLRATWIISRARLRFNPTCFQTHARVARRVCAALCIEILIARGTSVNSTDTEPVVGTD